LIFPTSRGIHYTATTSSSSSGGKSFALVLRTGDSKNHRKINKKLTENRKCDAF